MRRVEITAADLTEIILRKIDCAPEPGASLTITWRACEACGSSAHAVAVVDVDWLDPEDET